MVQCCDKIKIKISHSRSGYLDQSLQKRWMVVCLHNLHLPHPDMTIVLNDPADLPLVSYLNFLNYCVGS